MPFSIQYKPLMRYHPLRIPDQAAITDDDLVALDAQRISFDAEITNIQIRHPGYNEGTLPLLSFPRLDDGGVDYELAIQACYLLVQNAWPRDGVPTQDTPYLSYSRSPRDTSDLAAASVIKPSATGDTIIRRGCFLHVPSHKDENPYPITPTFAHWEFPHIIHPPPSPEALLQNPDAATQRPTPYLPTDWRKATISAFTRPLSGLKGRDAALNRDGTCRVTAWSAGLEAAHLVPKEASLWFNWNQMLSYARVRTVSNPWDDLANLLTLRADIHVMLDRKEVVIVPKKIDGRYVFVLKVIKAADPTYLFDIYHTYHNRICQDFLGVGIEFLFARFAWNIFDRQTVAINSTRRLRYYVRVRNRERGAFEVRHELASVFLPSRSQSTTGGSSRGSHSPSSRPTDGDIDDMLEPGWTESDEEDAYQRRLASMDKDQEFRGRKRSRGSSDRFSNANTEVGLESEIGLLGSKTGKIRKIGEEMAFRTRDNIGTEHT
ncbi:hypothetical protein F4818DRAFT_395412 [Hypoxylon cercidicola]|nr:hypothetical protein F4818DRAFT_395412 [Hypoxylon cercidicola]